ncbi:MAG: Fur family transcriptional regulator [Alphaproteobacteria bacterium]
MPSRSIIQSHIERRCAETGLKMTGQRRVIARILSEAIDHPDVEQVHRRAVEIDRRISLATVYRTVRLLEEAKILERHEFGQGRARYEIVPDSHHDHLIDMASGAVFEFYSEEIERLQRRVAKKLGYRLVDHRLALYGVPLKGKRRRTGRRAAGEAK